MSILPSVQRSSISAKWLIGIFCICSFTIMIVRLPASLLYQPLNDVGIEYSDDNGTIWDAKFSNIYAANMLWQDATVTIKKLPLLLGNIEAVFKLMNNERIISGTFIGFQDNLLAFRQASVFTNAIFRVSEKSYPSNININFEDAMFDKKGNCYSGVFKIKTDLVDNLFSNLIANLNPLEGQGYCEQGDVSYSLQSLQDDMEISVKGEIIGDTHKSILMFKLSQTLEQNKMVTNELLAHGFKKINDSWQVMMEGYL